MKSRRSFIKHAALGSAVLSAGGTLSVLGTTGCAGQSQENRGSNSGRQKESLNFQGWSISFDEGTSALSMVNGPVSLQGQLEFVSGDKKWAVANSRDGVPDRYALVDTQDNVQGYFVFIGDKKQVQIHFYHRTAQAYQGLLSFTGKIAFLPDGFACRTRPKADERILSLNGGPADSRLYDSLFAPESDTLLALDSASMQLITENPGTWTFSMSGKITEATEALFTVSLECDYMKERYVPYYHAIDRNRCPTAPTGWMSWNTYFDTATAEDNLAEARIGKKYLQPFGCEFWHIESWQGNSDKLPVRNFYNMNLEVSERKFPEGMKKLADDIRSLGFRPGLWTAPFGTGNKEFYEAHKDWFLHDKEGKPVSCWNGQFTLDPTVPEAREHLKHIHDIASHEWGYEYFKIDGMSGRSHGYNAHLYERPDIKAQFKDPSCPNPFELCVKAFREGMGEDRVFLACQGHTSGPEALYADASRIGADIVHANKPVEWRGVFNQGRCLMNQAFTHNIVMYADPDTLLVRDLPLEEARVSATIVALPGQLTFFGDKLANLPDDRMKILQQTLPPAQVRPGSLYPYFSMLPVWNLHVSNQLLGEYNIVALFNWEDEPKTVSFTTEELGIDPEVEYVLYEFWTEKSYGMMKGSFSTDVPPHNVRLMSVHKVREIPQWITSDRHIAQNGIELKEFAWKADNKSLEGKIELIGTFPLTMRIRVPGNYNFSTAECSGAACTAKKEADQVVAVTFLADKTGVYPFKIIC